MFTIKRQFDSQTTVAFERNLKKGVVFTALYGAGLVNNVNTDDRSNMELFRLMNNAEVKIGGKNVYVTGLSESNVSISFNTNPSQTTGVLGMYATVLTTVADLSQRDLWWWGQGTVWSHNGETIHYLVNINYQVVYI